jgi:copper homeostasis protein
MYHPRRDTDLDKVSSFSLAAGRLEKSLTLASTRSGQNISVPAGLHVLQELLQRSQKSGPVILPGAGINPRTIRHVLDSLLPYGLKEVHMSGGKWVEGRMVHRPVGMGMGAGEENEWKVWMTDGDTVREVRSVADDSATSA